MMTYMTDCIKKHVSVCKNVEMINCSQHDRLKQLSRKSFRACFVFATAIALSCLPAISNVNAQSSTQNTEQSAQDWWFDVEVIIFDRGLSLKDVQEQFDTSSPLSVPSFDLDLLTAARKPDVTSLYQNLKTCSPPPPQPIPHSEVLEWNYILEYGTTIDEDPKEDPLSPELSEDAIQAQGKLDSLIDSFNSDETPEQAPDANLIDNDDTEIAGELNGKDNTESYNLERAKEDEQLAVQKANFEIPYAQLWLEFNSPEFLTQTTIEYMPDLIAPIAFPPIGCFDENMEYDTSVYPITDTLAVNHYGQAKDESWGPHLLSKDDLNLNDLSLRIRRERGLTRLLHVAWRQPVAFGENNASKVRVYGGQNYALFFNEQGFPVEASSNTNPYESAGLSDTSNALIQDTLTDVMPIEFDSLSDFDRALKSASEGPFPTQNGINTQDIESFKSRLGQVNARHLNDDIAKHQRPSHQFPFHSSRKNNTTGDTYNENVSEKMGDNVIEWWQVDGTVKVYLQYVNRVPYLHIDGDIAYRAPAVRAQSGIDIANPTTETLVSIPYKQLRRVISTQLHYFDHPMFGMLIEIRRYKKPPAQQ